MLNQVVAPSTVLIWRSTGRSDPARRSTSMRSTYSTMSGLCFLLTALACGPQDETLSHPALTWWHGQRQVQVAQVSAGS